VPEPDIGETFQAILIHLDPFSHAVDQAHRRHTNSMQVARGISFGKGP
jgi:hypothetical protein